MAAYRIEFVKSAENEFAQLSRLSACLRKTHSELLNVKKLKGLEDVFRFRIGDYRVLYEIRNKRLVVVVIKSGHRRDIYRKL